MNLLLLGHKTKTIYCGRLINDDYVPKDSNRLFSMD